MKENGGDPGYYTVEVRNITNLGFPNVCTRYIRVPGTHQGNIWLIEANKYIQEGAGML